MKSILFYDLNYNLFQYSRKFENDITYLHFINNLLKQCRKCTTLLIQCCHVHIFCYIICIHRCLLHDGDNYSSVLFLKCYHLIYMVSSTINHYIYTHSSVCYTHRYDDKKSISYFIKATLSKYALLSLYHNTLIL